MAIRGMSFMGAVEDIDDEEVVGGDEEVTVDLPTETSDADDEVEDTQEVIDDASDDTERLEDIKDVLEEAADSGEGIDATAAKVVEVAVESIYARLGFSESNIMGSMESFSNSRTRVTATRMAAEAIGDKINKAWEAVKKFLKNLWEKIKELYHSYLTATGRARKAAKALSEKISRSAKGKKEDSFTDKSLGKAFCGADKKVTTASVSAQLEDTKKVLEGLQNVRLAVVTAIDAGKPKEVEDAMKLIGTSGKAKEFRGEEDAVATEYMLGNRAVVLLSDIPTGESTKVKFDAYIQTRDVKDVAEEIPVADKGDLKKWCEGVMAVCDKIDDLAKKDKDYDKILKVLDKTVKKDEKDSKVSVSIFRELVKVNGKLAYLPKSAALKGAYDLLRLVKRNLSMYTED
jgi:hypothetical protein